MKKLEEYWCREEPMEEERREISNKYRLFKQL
jgi:hypothetical protein